MDKYAVTLSDLKQESRAAAEMLTGYLKSLGYE